MNSVAGEFISARAREEGTVSRLIGSWELHLMVSG